MESQHVITIDANGNAMTDLTSIEEVTELLERTVNLSVYVNTADSQSRLNKLKNTLAEIKSKTVTVTTRTVGGGGNQSNYEKNAKGTDSFRGGMSLINEEGPELIAANGEASIYGGGMPTIAKIPRGAKIFTAEETAKILGSRLSMPAYAEGTNTIGDVASLFEAVVGGVGHGVVEAKLDPPKEEKKEEEEEKKSSGGGGSSKSEEDEEFWETIRKYIEYGLKKIQYQIDSYQDDITAIERARDALIKPIDEELEDLDYALEMLRYEVKLLERARDDAIKPLDEQIEALEKARDVTEEEIDLEEKRQALEDARHQRTIRYFNEETGQWEWMADQKAIADAEKAYNDALAEHEINVLKRQKEAIEEEYEAQIKALEEQEEILERREEDLEHEKTKIEYEYGEAIDPLQEALDKLQETYDDIDKYYQRLVDAVEVPTESLTEALYKMLSAGEQYSSQLESTVNLLNALYELAPTWSAVEVSDIGQYLPENGQYGNYNSVDQSTTVIIEGVTIEGSEARTLAEIFSKQRLYKK